MLFLATLEFGSAFPLVSRAFIVLYVGVVMAIFSVLPYNVFRSRRKNKGRTKICLTISLVFLTVAIPFMAITLIIPIFFVMTSLESIFLATAIIFLTSFSIGLVFMVLALPLMYKERKLRREEETMHRVYMDEGSGL